MSYFFYISAYLNLIANVYLLTFYGTLNFKHYTRLVMFF